MPSSPWAFDYFFEFANPILDLGLDIYDFRVEGGTRVGSTATLSGFADLDMSVLVGVDVFTVTGGLPDGNNEPLVIQNPSGYIRAASLVFSTSDGGVEVDNIRFTTAPIPEPTTMLLLGSLI